MARQISSVRIQFHYRRGARLFWKSSDGNGMPAGLQNGYAVTAFDSELELRQSIQHFKYSELFQQHEWKVGTAETTEIRLQKMFGLKRPLLSPTDIWDRFYIPLTDRLSKYQGDTKSLEAGQCAWMKEILLPKYAKNGRVAILMLPLILGFKGNANQLESQMSQMITNAGGVVVNDKKVQNEKERAASTDAQIGMPDTVGVDKMLKLTPTLQKMEFFVHPEYRKRK